MMANGGGRGKTAVPLHSMPWFHGKMTREDAERILTPVGIRENGLFLVRESAHYPGDYTLCLYFNEKVEHYHIIKNKEKLTIDKESSFDNLHQLVAHYEREADGLVSALLKPLTRVGNVEMVVNQNDFAESGWKIPLDHLRMQELIGKGEFSEVYRADYKGTIVAVKIVNCAQSTLQTFLAEARLMTSLQHVNLVQLLGVVLEEKLYIVTEYMSKGSLVDYLRTRGRAVITREDQIRFAKDSCSGMAYLETQKVVHRDLAARNVLIHENNHAKVSDFGLALPTEAQHTGGRIPIKWTAPETLRNNQLFTSKSDVWSFGILLWEIYSFGRVPYPKTPLADVMNYLETGNRMEAPDGCPPEVYEIMRKTWDWDPNKRPTFSEIRNQLVIMCSTAV